MPEASWTSSSYWCNFVYLRNIRSAGRQPNGQKNDYTHLKFSAASLQKHCTNKWVKNDFEDPNSGRNTKHKNNFLAAHSESEPSDPPT